MGDVRGAYTDDPCRRRRRLCSRVRWHRFPQLAIRPHPSRQWLRNRCFASVPMPKRRSERRSAPRPGSATHGYRRSGSETTAQAGRRHCSRVRWPRFPQLAFGPHRSNAGSETPSFPLPQRGNAYQPRATPWKPHPRESVCSEGTPHRRGRGRCPGRGELAATHVRHPLPTHSTANSDLCGCLRFSFQPYVGVSDSIRRVGVFLRVGGGRV